MLGEALALSAALTWSVSVVLFKRSEAISPQGMNLFKNLLSTLLLLATMPLLGVGFAVGRDGDDWWRLVISGVLGIAIADTLTFMALRRLGAALLAVVDCAYAPVIVGLGVLWLGEPLGPRFGIGAALVVAGVLMASSDAVKRNTVQEPSNPLDSTSRRTTRTTRASRLRAYSTSRLRAYCTLFATRLLGSTTTTSLR